MNRNTLISIGIIIVVFIAGIWGYLMLFGAPESPGDVYTNLGFDPVAQPVTITTPEIIEEESTLIDTTGFTLSQLTTRSIAGFATIASPDNNSVRYIERGTGHMYEIDLTSGVEQQISPTTIAQTSEAVFNNSATAVGIIVNQNYTSTLTLGKSNGNSLNLTPISNNAENIEFISDTELAYTESINGVTTGYIYNIENDTKTTDFEFAFSELYVWWGRGANNTYLLSKPAATLPTYSYEVLNGSLTPALPNLTGLTGFTNFKHHILTYRTNDSYISYQDTDGTLVRLPILALEQKCTFDPAVNIFLWCGSPSTVGDDTFVDDWYKGLVISEDLLWRVNLSTHSAQLVSNPIKESGRALDITQMHMNQTGNDLFFINRTDRTLWRYNLEAE